jgi:3-oxoadipate enol-lactonase
MIGDNLGLFTLEHWPDEPLQPLAWDRLETLAVPVLFIEGREDTPVVRRSIEETAAGVPGARLEVLGGADHLPWMTRPRAFTRLVRAFLLEP